VDLNAADVATGSISQIQTGSAASDIKAVPIPKRELKALLDVDETLASSQSKSLRIAYAKYTACLAAIQCYEGIVSEGKWPSKYEHVTITEIRQLFVSKSVWHAQYVPCFQDMTKYGEMLAWLERTTDDEDDDDDGADDESVWGKKKPIYHFSDLKEWLEKKKKEVKKEKAKAKVAKKTGETTNKVVAKKK
jgi:hypothetical protein